MARTLRLPFNSAGERHPAHHSPHGGDGAAGKEVVTEAATDDPPQGRRLHGLSERAGGISTFRGAKSCYFYSSTTF